MVIMTGDDHANNGTPGRFDIYNSNSVPGLQRKQLGMRPVDILHLPGYSD